MHEKCNTNSAEIHARQEVRLLQPSEGGDGREKDEKPADEKSKRGRPAVSNNTKKPCSEKVEGGGGGQEEARNGLQVQVDRLQGLLAAKRAYDEAMVSINRCVDAGVLTSGEAEAQRAEADATLNAAKEAAGVAAARTEIGTQEGAEKGKPAGEKSKPAGEKSKRGRPAGSKNASKKNIYDLSDATLAAVCSDLDLAPAVGSESSVREQKMRDIHAASGSTAGNVEEDQDRKIYTDCFVAGLPGKPCSSQLENINVDDLAASADVKVEGGGGGGQEEASRPSKTEALKDDKESAHVLSDFADDAAPPKSGDEHMRKRNACNNADQQQVIRLSVFRHIHSLSFFLTSSRHIYSKELFLMTSHTKNAEDDKAGGPEVSSVHDSFRSGSSTQCRNRSCWRRNGFYDRYAGR